MVGGPNGDGAGCRQIHLTAFFANAGGTGYRCNVAAGPIDQVEDIAAFYRVWLGRLAFADAVRRGDVRLEGMPADIRSFHHWFAWSPMADTVRAALLGERPPIQAKA